MRTLLVLLALTSTALAGDDAALAEALRKQVTITRDDYGVAHAEGETDAAAFFGFVYARAEDEYYRVERRILEMTGRSAELRGEAGVPWDRVIRAARWEARSKAEYRSAAPEVRALYDAAAAALNLFRRTHPDLKPLGVERFEPWQIVASERGFQVHFLLQAAAALNSKGGSSSSPRPRDGSNMWALGPSRCAEPDAKSLLLINPHINVAEVWEGHLRSKTGLDLYGGSAYGFLFPLFGFGPRHGWSLTVNYPDTCDVYLESFDDASQPLSYRYGEERRQAKRWTETIQVKTAAGLRPRQITLLATHHGPLLGKVGVKLAAVRVPGLDSGGQLAQLYAMARAKDAAAFQGALARRAVIFHNVLYADSSGTIHYVYNGAIPKRDPRFDWSKPVDGSDPRTEWQGLHPLSDLPQVKDPTTGYLQNCNSTPFTATTGLGRKAYPSYLIGAEPDNLRAINSRRLLGGQGRFTLATFSEAALDTYVPARVTWIPFLRAGWKALAKSDPKTAKPLAVPLDLLEAWDGYARTDSIATTLFFLWFERIYPLLTRQDALTHTQALRAWAETIAELGRRHGTWRLKWGELNRLQRPRVLEPEPWSDSRPSLPLAGGHGGTGILFNVIANYGAKTKRRYAYHGNSFVCTVAFTTQGPRARSVVPFGVSRYPQSPHTTDQAKVYAAGQLKPVRFKASEIAEHATRTYRPGASR
jgi:acyl-homoserine-lactone acylase